MRHLIHSLLTTDGRIGRTQFWYVEGMLIFAVASAVAFAYVWPQPAPIICAALICVISLPIHMVASIKRLHDIGHSGWWCLLSMLPIIGICFVLWIGATGSSSKTPQFGVPIAGLADGPFSAGRSHQANLAGSIEGVSGEYAGAAIALNIRNCTLDVGSSARGANLVFQKSRDVIDPKHATVSFEAGRGLLVRDEFSKYGTYVNGIRIPGGFSVPLHVGDEIEFGSSANRFIVKAS